MDMSAQKRKVLLFFYYSFKINSFFIAEAGPVSSWQYNLANDRRGDVRGSTWLEKTWIPKTAPPPSTGAHTLAPKCYG